MRALRRLVESRRDLVQDRVRLTNRLTFTLKAYFPQILDWFRDKETEVFAAFLERWPSLPDAQRARRETIVDFFHAHSVRRTSVIDRRIEAIKSERPLTSDAAVIEPARLLVEALLPQLRAGLAGIVRLRRRRSPVAVSSYPTTLSSQICLAPVVSSPLACSPPSGSNATALPTQPPSRSTPASLLSPSAAATSTGSTGAGRARPSCARPSSSGSPAPSRTRSGPAPSTKATEPKARPTTPPFAPSPSSGSASSFVAGSTAPPTTNPATSTPSRSVNRRFSNSPPRRLHKSLAVRLRARVRWLLHQKVRHLSSVRAEPLRPVVSERMPAPRARHSGTLRARHLSEQSAAARLRLANGLSGCRRAPTR